jgi:hypothetical protein
MMISGLQAVGASMYWVPRLRRPPMSDATTSTPIVAGPTRDRAADSSTPSVRELLAELARLEDATRDQGGARRPSWTVRTADLAAALAREHEIIEELHRRCPGAAPPVPPPDGAEGRETG